MCDNVNMFGMDRTFDEGPSDEPMRFGLQSNHSAGKLFLSKGASNCSVVRESFACRGFNATLIEL